MRYVIVGLGAAGANAALRLRQRDPAASVTVVSDEHDGFYSRVDLPDVIAGRLRPEETLVRPLASLVAGGVDCRLGVPVAALETERKCVRLASGETLRYDRLLLATGSRPVMPRFAAGGAAGVFCLWTLAQARAIVAAAGVRAAVVVGAGLIGLKTATALAARGVRVTVVEQLPRIMPRQLDADAAAVLDARIRRQRVEILTGCGVEALQVRDGAVCGVALANGRIDAQLVIVAVGVGANVDLAAAAGIALGARRGIRVDAAMQTSAADVYAAGDVAETTDRLSGAATIPAIWPVAVEQGRIAAANMAGGRERYSGSIAMNSVEIAGLPLVSVGDIEAREGDTVFVRRRGEDYRKIIVRGERLRGVVCLGDIRAAGVFAGLVHSQQPVAGIERLVSPGFGFADLIAV